MFLLDLQELNQSSPGPSFKQRQPRDHMAFRHLPHEAAASEAWTSVFVLDFRMDPYTECSRTPADN